MTPEQEEDVRRALAATARHEDPASTPPEVVARLDEVLAELAGTRAVPPAGHQGTARNDLATRPSRRGLHALVAAAAVVVIALAGAAVVTRGFGGDASSSSASSSTDSGSSATREKAPSAPGASGSSGGSATALPLLHSATLARDVARAIAARPGHVSTESAACARPTGGAGQLRRAVLLDGRPATLVVGPPRGGSRLARVYACRDAAEPLATTRVRNR